MNTARIEHGVPFLDLSSTNQLVAEKVRAQLESLLETSAFTNGPQVAEFEQAFAAYCGATYCVGVASGLDALRLTLIALDLQPGDEVLVPAMTFIATFEAVTQAGGVPVPVDVSQQDTCIDVTGCAAAVSPRTRFILPVHLYGRLVDLDGLARIGRSNGLEIIEDACQAHGAHRDGWRSRTAGIAGAFSFYPGKNLGAFGDAGAVVTEGDQLARRVRALREHGQSRKYKHDTAGWTARLDTIQAAVLLQKLPHLDGWNDQRRRVAALYDEGLAGVGDLVLPDVSDPGQVWHLFVIRTSDPAALASHLADRGIGTGRHYPEPPHLSAAYRHLGLPAGSFPVAEQIARETLSLPMFPGMTTGQAEQVVEEVRAWFADG